MGSGNDASDREARLDAIIAEYLEAADSGAPADRRQWLTSHPEFADALAEFFDDRDAIEQLASGLREVAQPADDEELPDDWLGAPSHPENLGRLGDYEVVERVGRGGMGVVFKAFDSGLNRYVAIKVLAPQWSADPGARRRFTREAQAAAAISHPHVITTHAVGEWRGRPYLVMEYITGASLQQRIDDVGPLELEEVLRIGVQAASALAAAHAQGLIHRDVKPGNIMLENDLARVKLTDFGLARAVDDTRLTQHGVLAGTPPYMAPEQARGTPLDRRADLFSLGSVLYAACTGRPAFRGVSTIEVIRRVCEESPPPIRTLNPDAPPWLVEIVERLHAKDPAERFQEASEVSVLLERHLARLRDPSLPPVEHPWLRGRRRAELRRAIASRVRRWTLAVPSLILLGALGSTLLSRLVSTTTAPPAAPALAEGTVRPAVAAAPSPPSEGTVRPTVAAPSPPVREGAIYSRDFRKEPYAPGQFRLSPAADRAGSGAISADPEGMRIAIPAGFGRELGASLPVFVHGDFEVTASYTIVDLEVPKEGHGVGAEIYLRALEGGADRKMVSLSRLVYPGKADGTTMFMATLGLPIDGKMKYQSRGIPTKSASGTLRLVRKGGEIRFLAREEGDVHFQQVHRIDFGFEDLWLRLAAITNGAKTPVTVLWKDVTVFAESLSDATKPPPPVTVAKLPVAPETLFDLPGAKSEYHFDFRDKRYDYRRLRIENGMTSSLVRPDPRGIRLAIPSGLGENLNVATKFGLRGDFDVAASFEVLSAERPKVGYGVGPELHLLSVDGWDRFVVTSSFYATQDDGGAVSAVHRARAGKGGLVGYRAAGKVKQGTLRLVRRGPTVHFLVAESGSRGFRELYRVNYGTTDFNTIRLGANLGGSKAGLDVVWKDLTVRAEGLPGLPGSPGERPQSPWWLAAVGLGATVLVGGWTWRRAASVRRGAEPAGPEFEPPAVLPGKGDPASADGWDDAGLDQLEERARAFAEMHPDATAYTERPQFHFSLRDGILHGPFVAWERVDKATLKRLGTTWDEVREKLPRRFQGNYRDGKRHGTFEGRGPSGETLRRRYRDGEALD